MSDALKSTSVTLMIVVLMCVGFACATNSKSGMETPPTVSRAYLNAHNIPSSGIALEGYCPVSYFVLEKPVKGSPEFASTYNGVTYLFVNEEAKSVFDSNPEQYLPAFGGWCAFGMAIQDKFPVDPMAYKIVDGRLLLFLRNENVNALELWNQNDERAQLAKAEAHWSKVSQ